MLGLLTGSRFFRFPPLYRFRESITILRRYYPPCPLPRSLYQSIPPAQIFFPWRIQVLSICVHFYSVFNRFRSFCFHACVEYWSGVFRKCSSIPERCGYPPKDQKRHFRMFRAFGRTNSFGIDMSWNVETVGAPLERNIRNFKGRKGYNGWKGAI